MPAVVRGGRRQGSASSRQGASRSPAPRARKGGGRNPQASGVPAKLTALGRLEMTPRGVILSAMAGAAVLGLVLFGGAQAGRAGALFSGGVDAMASGMGLKLARVHVAGASAEATPAIRAALALEAGSPMTGLDLDALRQQVEAVGWVEHARVVRLLPDTLIVEVTEHDRLAVWQANGRIQVIDGQGRIIRGADARRHPELPLVVGAGAETAAAAILPLIAERPRLASRIDAVIRVDERRWDLRLKDGGRILLPATGEDEALILLDSLDQRRRVLEMGFSQLDLRTPGDFAVRPAGA